MMTWKWLEFRSCERVHVETASCIGISLNIGKVANEMDMEDNNNMKNVGESQSWPSGAAGAVMFECAILYAQPLNILFDC